MAADSISINGFANFFQDMVNVGSAEVRAAYAKFHSVWPKEEMAEIGLTDLFMTGVQGYVNGLVAAGKLKPNVVQWAWSKYENERGSDIEVVMLVKQLTGKVDQVQFFIQAKIAKRAAGGQVYADFFYESSNAAKAAKPLQYELLNTYAASVNAEAFYLIYDWLSVWWVNVGLLKQQIGVQKPANYVNVKVPLTGSLVQVEWAKAWKPPADAMEATKIAHIIN